MGDTRGSFVPQRVFFEEGALSYPLGREMYDRFRGMGVVVGVIPPRGRVPGGRGLSPETSYREAKRTLVFAVRRSLAFQTCKPSAHYQLPLVTGCPGLCEYCYLQTTLGPRPYMRAYVNIDEIIERAARYIRDRFPETTVFEGAATSDPLPVEDFTGGLARAISFFGGQSHALFRFVTKFANVDGLLRLDHKGRTRFRFSVNAEPVIERYEAGTPRLDARLHAAGLVAAAGYPVGFLIAPVVVYDGWEDQYRDLLASLRDSMPARAAGALTFEIISHRFTPRAKSLISRRHPHTALPLDENERRVKMGQFGYVKYVYPDELLRRIDDLFRLEIGRLFPGARVDYVI
ncbi:MAG: spore photoproduct lyase [Firmicutes bacterium]|nr:spore photoproduct lyase [Bacillota bacterium]